MFRLGLRGSTEAFAGGAALLLVVVVHWRFVMSLEGDLVESDEEMTPAVMIARVRRGSMLRRLVVALWFGALAAVLLAFAHYWSGLFHVRGGGWKSALATIVGALLLFIGAFASNAALQGSLAAIGVGDRVLAWLWRHRFGLDASVAIIGVTLPASWTPTTGGGILP